MSLMGKGKGSQNSNGFQQKKIDFVFKVILIGQQNVGKTSILNQYVDHEFSESYLSTIGVDFRLKTIQSKADKSVKLQIWDTAGQERFAALTNSHYKGAHACLCVYDITSPKSFLSAETYLKTTINQHGIDPQMVFLLGNKSDLPEEQRQVTKDQGQKLSYQYGTNFIETSAKTAANIEELFAQLVDHLVDIFTNPAIPKKLSQLNIKINQNDLISMDEAKKQQKESSCC